MPTVRLEFTAEPQYVRTARLVGVAVARRAGVAEELLDDIRLAVGEACARAIARHRRHHVDEPVRVEMTDDGPYVVRVIDAARRGDGTMEAAGALTAGAGAAGGAGGAGAAGAGSGPPDGGEDDPDRMAERVLAGLVDHLQVDGGEVRMVWPVRRRLGWR